MISQNDYSSKLNNFFGFMFIFMAYINPKVSQYDLEKKVCLDSGLVHTIILFKWLSILSAVFFKSEKV